jgi:hypothetical protein
MAAALRRAVVVVRRVAGTLQTARHSIATTASAICLAIAFGLVLGVVGPSIDDHGAEHAQALALQDAIKASHAAERFADAARAVCGENGAWRNLGDGTVQCYTHRGAKTMLAKVQP